MRVDVQMRAASLLVWVGAFCRAEPVLAQSCAERSVRTCAGASPMMTKAASDGPNPSTGRPQYPQSPRVETVAGTRAAPAAAHRAFHRRPRRLRSARRTAGPGASGPCGDDMAGLDALLVGCRSCPSSMMAMVRRAVRALRCSDAGFLADFRGHDGPTAMVDHVRASGRLDDTR